MGFITEPLYQVDAQVFRLSCPKPLMLHQKWCQVVYQRLSYTTHVGRPWVIVPSEGRKLRVHLLKCCHIILVPRIVRVLYTFESPVMNRVGPLQNLPKDHLLCEHDSELLSIFSPSFFLYIKSVFVVNPIFHIFSWYSLNYNSLAFPYSFLPVHYLDVVGRYLSGHTIDLHKPVKFIRYPFFTL